ncbi:MAG: glycoside hydrolase family 3 N-terminal domain-containing protein [Planctomycetota bacterium]|nr:glycoside hydrolase family 3 N-terminal domain-containing protein [Planctomycetota bacterium]
MNQAPPPANRRELERWIGAVIIPPYRPAGGFEPGSPERRPSAAYLRRFPPTCLIGFGRRLSDGATIAGMGAGLNALADECVELGGQRPSLCADLERGAGYHLPGSTLLPPARAVFEAEAQRPGSLFDAGLLTGLEARAAGIDLVLAPVLDVNSNPVNPIISVRAFGTEPGPVAAGATAFLEGLDAAGAGASLKHFPGHGDTAVDSHVDLPLVDRSLAELEALELAPWRGFFDLPVARRMGARLTVMVGHLDVPALTGEPGLPATLSARSNAWLAAAGFEGVVLSDGLEMGAVAQLPDLGVRALEAGCHGLLVPVDELALAEQLLEAVEGGRLDVEVLRQAAERMQRMRAALVGAARPDAGVAERVENGERLATELTLAGLAGQPGAAAAAGLAGSAIELAGQADLVAGLVEVGGLELTRDPAAPLVLCLGGVVLAGRGSAGAEAEVEAEAQKQASAALEAGRRVLLLWFGARETLPEWGAGFDHLWAWAPGSATARGVVALLTGGSARLLS